MPGAIAKLFQDFERGELDTESFHDALAMAVPLDAEKKGPTQLDHLPQSVRTYYAAWSVSADLVNGGFAQAAFNHPHRFDDASRGFRELGLPNEAALIAKAKAMIDEGAANFEQPATGDIEELFEEFLESTLAELDDELDDLNFWPVEERVAYAVRHRAEFEGVG